MRKIGFEVFCTRNEEELFEVLKTESINVVIIDYNLQQDNFDDVPKTQDYVIHKNGLEIIGTIREKWTNTCMKIVLTTTKNNASIHDVKNVGGNDILFKPFCSFSDLAKFLTGLMEKNC